MKPVTKGWLEAAKEYMSNGKVPRNSDWHLLMVEHLLYVIDEFMPKVEPKLTQCELRAVRKLINKV